MMQPVDLTNLRAMLDGDKDLELALLEEFIRSSTACLNSMAAGIGDAAGEMWRTQSHSLKGISINLGAMRLGELCKQAQDAYTLPAAERLPLYHAIEAELADVHQFLKVQLAA
jgi:HPt (histidine-containing phosphotransfer) domain-containing protein